MCTSSCEVFFFFNLADRENYQIEVSKEEAEKVYKVTGFMDTETDWNICNFEANIATLLPYRQNSNTKITCRNIVVFFFVNNDEQIRHAVPYSSDSLFS